jgi:hypothetical protein
MINHGDGLKLKNKMHSVHHFSKLRWSNNKKVQNKSRNFETKEEISSIWFYNYEPLKYDRNYFVVHWTYILVYLIYYLYIWISNEN